MTKLDDQYGYIDLFWKGVLIVGHKSRGKSLWEYGDILQNIIPEK